MYSNDVVATRPIEDAVLFRRSCPGGMKCETTSNFKNFEEKSRTKIRNFPRNALSLSSEPFSDNRVDHNTNNPYCDCDNSRQGSTQLGYRYPIFFTTITVATEIFLISLPVTSFQLQLSSLTNLFSVQAPGQNFIASGERQRMTIQ